MGAAIKKYTEIDTKSLWYNWGQRKSKPYIISSILSIFSVTFSVEYGIELCAPCPCWIWKTTCTTAPHRVVLMHDCNPLPLSVGCTGDCSQTVTVSVQRFKQRKVWCSSVSPSLVLSLALFDRNKTLSSELPYRGSGVKELRDAFSLLAIMGGSLEMVFSSVAFMWCQLQLTPWFSHWEWFWAQTPRKKVPRSPIHINS